WSGTRRPSGTSPWRGTARGPSRAGRTGWCGCGTWRRARSFGRWRGTRGRARAWRCRPTASGRARRGGGARGGRGGRGGGGGRGAAGAGHDGRVRLWDLVAGEEKWQAAPHAGQAFSLAFSPAGGELFSGWGDGRVVALEAETGRVVREVGRAKAGVLSI